MVYSLYTSAYIVQYHCPYFSDIDATELGETMDCVIGSQIILALSTGYILRNNWVKPICFSVEKDPWEQSYIIVIIHNRIIMISCMLNTYTGSCSSQHLELLFEDHAKTFK